MAKNILKDESSFSGGKKDARGSRRQGASATPLFNPDGSYNFFAGLEASPDIQAHVNRFKEKYSNPLIDEITKDKGISNETRRELLGMIDSSATHQSLLNVRNILEQARTAQIGQNNRFAARKAIESRWSVLQDMGGRSQFQTSRQKTKSILGE